MALNRNQQALADYVERLVNIDTELEEAKQLAKESKKDLLAEIKSNFEATGVNGADVKRGAKLRKPKHTIAERQRDLDEDKAYLAEIGWDDGILA